MMRYTLLVGRGLVLAAAVCVVSLPAAAQDNEAGAVVVEPGTVEHFGRMFDVEFGTFQVPMNRRDPDNQQTFALRFVRYKSTSPDPGHPAVYLAGGATKLAAVRDGVEAYFGMPGRHTLDPMEVVAYGASLGP